MTVMRRYDETASLWKEFEAMRRRMMSAFDRGDSFAVADWTPAVDVVETDTEYRIHAALPAVKKEDLQVTIQDGVLTIRGERKARTEEKSAKRRRIEIEEGTFLRSFAMPDDADSEKVTAKYRDGVLEVSIAKAPPKKAASARTIAVQ